MTEQAYRGACLTCFKLGQYHKAEGIITQGIKILKLKRNEQFSYDGENTIMSKVTISDAEIEAQKERSM